MVFISNGKLHVSTYRGHHLVLTAFLLYLLTPWSRVLLEKLASLQLVKKFPAFYGTRRFLTALTNARHLSLSWASPIQSSYPNPTSWRPILILFSHLRLGLPSGLFPDCFVSRGSISPIWVFHNRGFFLRRGVVSTSPNPQPGGPGHPF